nr:immunoglobulin heavy chain junction region [Macaca mulatta]MOV90178.1 immunoglobulin heavy chain junction region [Macaca mulatta]
CARDELGSGLGFW